MNYLEACELSEGQKYAFVMALKALPTPKPVPEQEAIIGCFAPVNPVIDKSYQEFPDHDHVRVRLNYGARGDAQCIMERPTCEKCRMYNIAQELQSCMVTLSNEDFKSGNLEAFKPQI